MECDGSDELSRHATRGGCSLPILSRFQAIVRGGVIASGFPSLARGLGDGALSGGALPVWKNGVVISLARMNRILESGDLPNGRA